MKTTLQESNEDIWAALERRSKNRSKPTHGGKRPGSGRPRGEPTTTIRIPVSKLEEVKALIKK